jgi:hypothetical protein
MQVKGRSENKLVTAAKDQKRSLKNRPVSVRSTGHQQNACRKAGSWPDNGNMSALSFN